MDDQKAKNQALASKKVMVVQEDEEDVWAED